MEDLGLFIDGLPKAELHVHVEGTLEPEMMLAMAERNGIDLPYANADAARAAYRSVPCRTCGSRSSATSRHIRCAR